MRILWQHSQPLTELNELVNKCYFDFYAQTYLSGISVDLSLTRKIAMRNHNTSRNKSGLDCSFH